MTDHESLREAALDTLLSATTERQLLERSARSTERTDPDVSQAFRAQAAVQESIIAAMRRIIVAEQE